MLQGQFCFLKDEYYRDFPDSKLMRNKETVDGVSHRRPCFFVFADNGDRRIYWVVPISSKAEKFRPLYDAKVAKYGRCNTIRFGNVLGTNAAFLIQNMCPVTEKYIECVYVDTMNRPIQIDGRLAADVIRNAREVLAKERRGARIVFPNIKAIYAGLLSQLSLEEKKQAQDKPQHPKLDQTIAAARAAATPAKPRDTKPPDLQR